MVRPRRAALAKPTPALTRARIARVLSRPWLIWTLAGIFAIRDLALSVVNLDRPDTGTFWSAGRLLLTHAPSLYDQSAGWIARYHLNPLPGDITGFISPPPVAFVFAPYGLLPRLVGVELWNLTDALLLVIGLLLLDRQLGLSGSRRAAYWLVALYFPPLFAEISAGQIGGLLVFLAAVSCRFYVSRPGLAGLFAGLAGSLKFYPGAMVMGAGGWRRAPYWLASAASFAAVLVLSFLPLGVNRLPLYFGRVLLPSLTGSTPDCGVVSVSTMISRYVGGSSWAFPSPDGHGVTWEQLPWSFPLASHLLAAAVPLSLIVLAWWACRRSGYSHPYGLLLGFSLGALVPGMAFPYQLLALLPVTLVVLSRCIADRAVAPILCLTVGLALFVRAPCDMPVANIWTAGALIIFATNVWQAKRFRFPGLSWTPKALPDGFATGDVVPSPNVR